MNEILILGGLFFRRTLFRLRALGLVIGVLGLDVAIAMAWRAESDLAGAELLGRVTNELVIGFVLPFVALFYGVAVVRDEMEGGTLPYLLTRPIPRHVVYGARLGAALGAALAIVVGLTGVHALILGATPTGDQLTRLLVALSLGCLAYGGLFSALGAVFQRPFLIGLFALLMVDAPLSRLPMVVRHITIRANLANIAGLSEEPEGLAKLIDTTVDVGSSYMIILGVLVVALVVGFWAFERREFHGEEQA